ncbi:MAG TPA: methyltransferase [Candidatus Sulfotelmatobacter sp.]|jgi:FkbM family methyltransferase|nr:methyltransferase [Candidatus Sulfotelmatobacter sp.]
MSEYTEDTLMGGRILLRQPAEGYRAAIDPLFLAAAVPAQDGHLVLDVGSGVGAASLCLGWRVPGCRIIGLEPQAELVALARDNITLNNMTGRVETVIGSIQAPPPRLAPGSFHHVMTNPPYHKGGTPSPHAGKAQANTEAEVDVAAWMRMCVAMLRPKGTLLAVHRADRLDELLAALQGRVGEVIVFPLWPKRGRAAKRILLRARKSVHSPLTLHPGLILHEEDGRYSAEADAVLRLGAAID